MAKRIGILGGTFNPIHLGHLFVGCAAAEAFSLDHVLMLPCTVSPFKVDVPGLASGAERLEMVRRGVAGDARFKTCRLDLERGGVSYALDSVKGVLENFPGARVSFIIGGDSLKELHHWYRIEEMLQLCDVITVQRPGVATPVTAAELPFPEEVRTRLLANIIPGRACDISSTEIRTRVAEGRSIRYLVPLAVEEYILERGLYRKDVETARESGD